MRACALVRACVYVCIQVFEHKITTPMIALFLNKIPNSFQPVFMGRFQFSPFYAGKSFCTGSNITATLPYPYLTPLLLHSQTAFSSDISPPPPSDGQEKERSKFIVTPWSFSQCLREGNRKINKNFSTELQWQLLSLDPANVPSASSWDHQHSR